MTAHVHIFPTTIRGEIYACSECGIPPAETYLAELEKASGRKPVFTESRPPVVRSEEEIRAKMQAIRDAAAKWGVSSRQPSVASQLAALLWAVGDVDHIWQGLALLREEVKPTQKGEEDEKHG